VAKVVEFGSGAVQRVKWEQRRLPGVKLPTHQPTALDPLPDEREKYAIHHGFGRLS
jgi:hypothetical protein